MAFDKKKYDLEYQKKYKQFKARISPEEMDELNKILDKLGMSKADLVRWAMEELKKKDVK